jgi:BRCT domain type II-containing protein
MKKVTKRRKEKQPTKASRKNKHQCDKESETEVPMQKPVKTLLKRKKPSQCKMLHDKRLPEVKNQKAFLNLLRMKLIL